MRTAAVSAEFDDLKNQGYLVWLMLYWSETTAASSKGNTDLQNTQQPDCTCALLSCLVAEKQYQWLIHA